jgi:protein-disulfide isomerase
MTNKNVFIASLVTVLISFGLLYVWYTDKEKQKVAEAAPNSLMRDSAMALGREGASVTVVEFFDPECESCRYFHPYLKSLVKDYGDRVRFVFRYAPFHGNSKMVVKILEASRLQDKYWETLETLYQTQPQWGDHHNPRPELIWNFLKPVVDIDKIKVDMNNPLYDELIQKDLSDGSQLGVRMTPSFFVNNDPLTRFSYEDLKNLIESHLNR